MLLAESAHSQPVGGFARTRTSQLGIFLARQWPPMYSRIPLDPPVSRFRAAPGGRQRCAGSTIYSEPPARAGSSLFRLST
eukprot:scaffold827_cov369-Prasinococcus_capsulatus_cf.AAC.2